MLFPWKINFADEYLTLLFNYEREIGNVLLVNYWKRKTKQKEGEIKGEKNIKNFFGEIFFFIFFFSKMSLSIFIQFG